MIDITKIESLVFTTPTKFLKEVLPLLGEPEKPGMFTRHYYYGREPEKLVDRQWLKIEVVPEKYITAFKNEGIVWCITKDEGKYKIHAKECGMAADSIQSGQTAKDLFIHFAQNVNKHKQYGINCLITQAYYKDAEERLLMFQKLI